MIKHRLTVLAALCALASSALAEGPSLPTPPLPPKSVLIPAPKQIVCLIGMQCGIELARDEKISKAAVGDDSWRLINTTDDSRVERLLIKPTQESRTNLFVLTDRRHFDVELIAPLTVAEADKCRLAAQLGALTAESMFQGARATMNQVEGARQ